MGFADGLFGLLGSVWGLPMLGSLGFGLSKDNHIL